MVQPLHSSFTLRPRDVGKRPELTLRETRSDPSGFRWETPHTPTEDSQEAHHVVDEEANYERKRYVFTSPSKNVTRVCCPSDAHHCSYRHGHKHAYQQQRQIHPGSSRGDPSLPPEFQPPADEEYWKKRCFQWQSICQNTRKRMRDMEEDQRQLRRRIWQLEDAMLHLEQKENQELPKTDGERVGKQDGNEDAEAVTKTTADEESNCIPSEVPSVIIISPSRNACFYLTDSEGLSEPEDYTDDFLEGDEENDQDSRRED